jgi:competence protein ComEC
MEVLWPPEPIPAGLTVNDTSLVLRVRCGGRSVLLPGDLDETGQATLIERPGALRCDAMVLPHHGGWERCLPEFVAAARARTLLVSSGRWPRPPAGASVAAEDFYRSLQGPHCRGTNRDGWIRLRFGESILDVKTMRDGRR